MNKKIIINTLDKEYPPKVYVKIYKNFEDEMFYNLNGRFSYLRHSVINLFQDFENEMRVELKNEINAMIDG